MVFVFYERNSNNLRKCTWNWDFVRYGSKTCILLALLQDFIVMWTEVVGECIVSLAVNPEILFQYNISEISQEMHEAAWRLLLSAYLQCRNSAFSVYSVDSN